jgi:hypothetical protein
VPEQSTSHRARVARQPTGCTRGSDSRHVRPLSIVSKLVNTDFQSSRCGWSSPEAMERACRPTMAMQADRQKRHTIANEHDLPERNERFLSSIDGEYFNYVAQRHLDNVEARIVNARLWLCGLDTIMASRRRPNASRVEMNLVPNCSTKQGMYRFLAASCQIEQVGSTR